MRKTLEELVGEGNGDLNVSEDYGDPVRPTHEGEPLLIGWARGGAVSGSPVSCRKSTRVIPQVSTVCPVRTSIPELSSGQKAMALAPARAHPEEARGRWGR